jgi:putative Mg2+ transporter-C (MgtC) family protein
MANESSPTRMAAQIVSGIGFLGAGLIMREGNHVRGLNTAATVWCSAAVGTLCGSGFFTEAVCGTLAILVSNVILRPLSLKMAAVAPGDLSDLETVYLLKLTCHQTAEQRSRALLMNSVLRTASTLRSLLSEKIKDSDLVNLAAQIITPGKQDEIMETIVSELGIDDKIDSISWEVQSIDSGKE